MYRVRIDFLSYNYHHKFLRFLTFFFLLRRFNTDLNSNVVAGLILPLNTPSGAGKTLATWIVNREGMTHTKNVLGIHKTV